MLTGREMILELATNLLALIVVAGYLVLLIVGRPPDDTYKAMAVAVVSFYFAQRSNQRAVTALRDSNTQLTSTVNSTVAANTTLAANGNTAAPKV